MRNEQCPAVTLAAWTAENKGSETGAAGFATSGREGTKVLILLRSVFHSSVLLKFKQESNPLKDSLVLQNQRGALLLLFLDETNSNSLCFMCRGPIHVEA